MDEEQQETFSLEEMLAPKVEEDVERSGVQLESKLLQVWPDTQLSNTEVDEEKKNGPRVEAEGDRTDGEEAVMVGGGMKVVEIPSWSSETTQPSGDTTDTEGGAEASDDDDEEEEEGEEEDSSATPRAGDSDAEEDQEATAGSLPSSQLDEGYQTPTSPRHRIPPVLECPPAPRRPRCSLRHCKRKQFGGGEWGVRRLVRRIRIYPVGSDLWMRPVDQFPR